MKHLALSVALLVPVGAFATDVRFASPSGNITCSINQFVATCTIREYLPTFTNRPADCDGEWGNNFFVLGRGEARLGCLTGEVDQADETLPYGESIAIAELACTSRTTGITCINAEGRGFALRRAEQRIF